MEEIIQCGSHVDRKAIKIFYTNFKIVLNFLINFFKFNKFF